jgi:hypothetical protein
MKNQTRREFVRGGALASLGVGMNVQRASEFWMDVKGELTKNSKQNSLTVHGNPIVPGVGLCDPQVRVFNGSVYLYATHDYSPENKFFRMDNWWVWHSDDLVHWQLVSFLEPQETFLRKPFTECWATDAGTRNGKFYFYFSASPYQIGVVVGDTPSGPWQSPFGKPLIPKGLTPTQERDPGILMDDDGSNYIVFGTWNYYIAKLNEDMISLAEAPRLIEIEKKVGPYGVGKTDDKPFLHKRNGVYYLSWGCFYAMGKSPYGPFVCKGSIVNLEDTEPDFRTDNIVHDRHGSFFEFNGQWYFACNDASQKGSQKFFRNSILSYIHYRDNGEIAPIHIGSVGVGRYDAARGKVGAADYFKIQGGYIREAPEGGFEVRGLADGSFLVYPNVLNVPTNAKLILHCSSQADEMASIEVRRDHPEGELLGHAMIHNTGGWEKYGDFMIPIDSADGSVNLVLVARGSGAEIARLQSWEIV